MARILRITKNGIEKSLEIRRRLSMQNPKERPMVRCGACGKDNIDGNFMEAFDGWNWIYVCGKGEITACRGRVREQERQEKESFAKQYLDRIAKAQRKIVA